MKSVPVLSMALSMVSSLGGGDDRLLDLLAVGFEAAAEGAEARVVPRGLQGCTVEQRADRASAADRAYAAPVPRVVDDRREADKRGDTAPVEAAELGKLGDERCCDGRADARRRLQAAGNLRQLGSAAKA